VSWQCPNCLHHTADGQKHECINDAYDAVVKERDELRSMYNDQRAAYDGIKKVNGELTEQVEAFRSALEAYEHLEIRPGGPAREVLAKWPKEK
jgi:hypothetical protein